MAPKKKVAAVVKVAIQAGAATPAPPVGTALGLMRMRVPA